MHPDDQWLQTINDDDSPITIGRYQIVGHLGNGGMGDVLSARDQQLRRMVAIKIVRQDSIDDRQAEQLRDFLIGEGRAIANLIHPNICRLYDLGEEDGVWYLVMELIDGMSVSKLLSSRVHISPQLAFKIVRAAAAGLDYAHQNGVVHRDIKPGNLMITRDRSVKILDFGIARLDSTTTGKRASEYEIVGTPSYMSPEQLRGERVGGATDQYALAKVTKELLGRHTSCLTVERVLARALSQSPEQRYKTCSDFASALKAACLVAHVPTMPPRQQGVSFALNCKSPEPETSKSFSPTFPDAGGA
jgi:serine/threonine-protein kinase